MCSSSTSIILITTIFQVTDQWKHKGAAFTNRTDAVFLINGIPVAIVETKSAEKREGWRRA